MIATVGLDRIDQILHRATRTKITVVGDLMLDIYLSGAVHRISPEAPVPVVQVVEERTALGGAANVAANVLRRGARCDVIGFAGSDAAGDLLRRGIETLDGGAVRAILVDTPGRPTTTKTRVMARKQQVVRYDREVEDDLPAEAGERLCDRIRESVRDSDVLVLEDYNKGVLTPGVIASALMTAREANVPVVVDPKFRNIFEYQGATVFKPNALELTSALGMPIEPGNDGWLEQARSRFDCDYLLVTLGEAGMVIRSRSGETTRVPAVAREVFDVSGAGDTVTAFVAVALAGGADIREAAVIANFAAAIEVGKPGVATVAPRELREMVEHFHAEPMTVSEIR
ncbi:MAG TPA: bifunctional ADP-heptose synthase [Longimicrobiaceae bacterium]|nr:bifunctional ADP-heptose synthase [Longimicrobiaceae bacterium]